MLRQHMTAWCVPLRRGLAGVFRAIRSCVGHANHAGPPDKAQPRFWVRGLPLGVLPWEPVLASLVPPPHTPVATMGPGGVRFITFADEAGAKAVFAAGEFHTIGSKQIQVKHATPRGSMPQPQPGSAAPGAGAGPSGSRVVFAPRPGFTGAYGGAVGQPGAYGPMGAYGPPVQYHVGPGYGMPAYGQVRSARRPHRTAGRSYLRTCGRASTCCE